MGVIEVINIEGTISDIQLRTVDLTSAEILALNTTQIGLVPAVEGRFILMEWVRYEHDAATAYATTANLVVRYETSNDTVSEIASDNILDTASDTDYIVQPEESYEPAIGEGLELHTSASKTAGTGTMKVTVAYRIL